MAWLTGWSDRKSITIAGSTAGTQTNYQMQLTVYKGSGTDSTGIIYCNIKCRDDFGDIRFTQSDETTLLNYWIDPTTLISGTSTNIYVQINSIPASPSTATIYIYYNNPPVTTTSNGTNTFLAFDDFESGNTSKWSIQSGTTFIAETSVVKSGTYSAGYNSNSWSEAILSYPQQTQVIMEADLNQHSKPSTRTYVRCGGGGVDDGVATAFDQTYILYFDGYFHNLVTYNWNQWYKWKWIVYTNTQKFDLFVDGTQLISGASYQAPIPYADNINIAGVDGGAYTYIDNVRISKYISPPPTWGAVGSERASASFDASLIAGD